MTRSNLCFGKDHCLLYRTGLANFFCKGTIRKYFKFCGPDTHCCCYSTLLWQHEVNQTIQLLRCMAHLRLSRWSQSNHMRPLKADLCFSQPSGFLRHKPHWPWKPGFGGSSYQCRTSGWGAQCGKKSQFESFLCYSHGKWVLLDESLNLRCWFPCSEMELRILAGLFELNKIVTCFMIPSHTSGWLNHTL